MNRTAALLVLSLTSWCTSAFAGSWTDGLFSELRHEFGNVPRGSDQRCSFVITNKTGGPVRIAGLSRTCGCTLITLDDKVVLDQIIKQSREGKVLQPGQESRVGVVLDTRNFIGNKSAEITVSFDQPAHTDVRLTLNSFIRQDIVLNPGAIQFGSLSRGQEMTKELDIEYAGLTPWKILSVTNPNPNIDVNFEEMYRRPGQAGYKLKVNLKSSAPAGTVKEALIVETNDPGVPQFQVIVSGQVQPDLIVTPSNLTMGTVKPGQSISRQVLLRGRKPFQVISVEGADTGFEVEKPQGSQTFHKVLVRFAGSDEPGTRECTIRVQTDLADESAAEIKASVQVVR